MFDTEKYANFYKIVEARPTLYGGKLSWLVKRDGDISECVEDKEFRKKYRPCGIEGLKMTANVCRRASERKRTDIDKDGKFPETIHACMRAERSTE